MSCNEYHGTLEEEEEDDDDDANDNEEEEEEEYENDKEGGLEKHEKGIKTVWKLKMEQTEQIISKIPAQRVREDFVVFVVIVVVVCCC